MKIELWYDPVFTEIKVKLNGVWQDETDMYGFLYPVRRYPIQTWIRQIGSWNGLGQQIVDLSRGESMELVFHGRKIDFEDIQSALEDFPAIRLHYIAWDTESDYKVKIQDILSDVQKKVFDSKKDQGVITQLLNQKHPWFFELRGEADWAAAERSELPCIFLKESYPNDYSSLHRMERFTRSLRRPAEAICCCCSEPDTAASLKEYASQYPRMTYSFCLTGEKERERYLYQKYGSPYCIKMQLSALQSIQTIIKERIQKAESYKERKADLLYKQMDNGLSAAERRELSDLNDRLSWALHMAAPLIDRINEAIRFRVIDSLGGV